MPDTPHVFGYGSLVNRATHDMAPAIPARLSGWRRVWVATPRRNLAFLSVHPAAGVIEGLLAPIPGGDWRALDAREAAYRRHPASDALRVAGPLPGAAMVYAIDRGEVAREPRPMLLSYLDVVAQGFLRAFGAAGLADFAATTDGWEAPVQDDRATPLYPRHQRLTPAERAAVDEMLESLGSRVLRG